MHVALHGRSSAGEITAEVRLGSRECVFAYKVKQGSFLGLSNLTPLQAESSPTAVSPGPRTPPNPSRSRYSAMTLESIIMRADWWRGWRRCKGAEMHDGVPGRGLRGRDSRKGSLQTTSSRGYRRRSSVLRSQS